MTTYITQLTQLGLTENEARIYRALLELGRATVLEVAKHAEIKRTTVYPGLLSMLRAGIVRKTVQKKKRYFFVEDVNDLKASIEEKESILTAVLPGLRELHNIFPTKIKTTYYEGSGSVKHFYTHILNQLQSGDTIFEFIGSETFTKSVPESLISFYPAERVRRKISIKTITSNSTTAALWLRDSKKFLREIRLVPRGSEPFAANMQIYKNGIGIISYKDDFMSVVIESGEVGKMFLTAFQLMWAGLKTTK